MKTVTMRGIMADFLDSIRAYEHESGEGIYLDERESSEFVDIYFNGGDKFKIEEQKPLFITDDGVEVFDRDEYISIGSDFSKISMLAYNCDAPYSSDVTRFKHESNADDYIWRNKPLFSYEDFIKWANDINASFAELSQLAKERIGQ